MEVPLISDDPGFPKCGRSAKTRSMYLQKFRTSIVINSVKQHFEK